MDTVVLALRRDRGTAVGGGGRSAPGVVHRAPVKPSGADEDPLAVAAGVVLDHCRSPQDALRFAGHRPYAAPQDAPKASFEAEGGGGAKGQSWSRAAALIEAFRTSSFANSDAARAAAPASEVWPNTSLVPNGMKTQWGTVKLLSVSHRPKST